VVRKVTFHLISRYSRSAGGMKAATSLSTAVFNAREQGRKSEADGRKGDALRLQTGVVGWLNIALRAAG